MRACGMQITSLLIGLARPACDFIKFDLSVVHQEFDVLFEIIGVGKPARFDKIVETHPLE